MLRYWSKALVSALMLIALPFEKAFDFDADREAMECLKGSMNSLIMLDTRLFSMNSSTMPPLPSCSMNESCFSAVPSVSGWNQCV